MRISDWSSDVCSSDHSALSGISRSTIHALAADLGIPLQTKRLTRDDLYIADEAFFTGTAAEVTPIREVDGRTIGKGRCGPVTEKLQKAFFDAVNGKNPKYQDWLKRSEEHTSELQSLMRIT